MMPIDDMAPEDVDGAYGFFRYWRHRHKETLSEISSRINALRQEGKIAEISKDAMREMARQEARKLAAEMREPEGDRWDEI